MSDAEEPCQGNTSCYRVLASSQVHKNITQSKIRQPLTSFRETSTDARRFSHRYQMLIDLHTVLAKSIRRSPGFPRHVLNIPLPHLIKKKKSRGLHGGGVPHLRTPERRRRKSIAHLSRCLASNCKPGYNSLFSNHPGVNRILRNRL